jgi:mitogen-activated protein kinase kinase
MMEQHNRKSYLAPPAPKSIARDGSRDALSYSYSRQPDSPAGQRYTPLSGEIPVNYAGEPSPRRRADHPAPARLPPTLGLEHLSLGNHDQINGSGGARPARPPNTTQSFEAHLYSHPRSADQHSPASTRPGLPIRTAPPPTGPLPALPGSGGIGSLRSQGHRV